jgi:hypothetical protein
MKLGKMLNSTGRFKSLYLNKIVFDGKFHQINNGFKIELLHDMIFV